MRTVLAASGLALALTLGSAAHAAPIVLSFDCITPGLTTQCDIGEAQLQVQVSSVPGVGVEFKFLNLDLDPSQESSITAVYIQSNSVLSAIGNGDIMDGSGVSFSEGATPGHLPGGKDILTADIVADSDPAVSHSGVNPGEMFTILFSMADFAAVEEGLTNGTIRIGLKVQSFASEESASFVNVPVPEPSAALLFLAGTAVAAHSIRRRR